MIMVSFCFFFFCYPFLGQWLDTEVYQFPEYHKSYAYYSTQNHSLSKLILQEMQEGIDLVCLVMQEQLRRNDEAELAGYSPSACVHHLTPEWFLMAKVN